MHDIECREFENVNNLLTEYNLAWSEVLDKHAPPVIKTRKVRYHPARYDESVQNARRERRRCERKWRKSRTDIDYKQYRESQQKVSDQIRSAKTSYYDNKLSNCSVKAWSLILLQAPWSKTCLRLLMNSYTHPTRQYRILNVRKI